MGDQEINVENVILMLDLHDQDDGSAISETPLNRTRAAAAKTVRVTVDKFKELFIPVKERGDEETMAAEKNNLATVVNSIVKVVTELMGKVKINGAYSNFLI